MQWDGVDTQTNARQNAKNVSNGQQERQPVLKLFLEPTFN